MFNCTADWGLTTPVENNHIEQPDLGYVLFRDDYVSIYSLFQLNLMVVHLLVTWW